MQSITSFALYGFPESHAASFALLAYASAYLKCHYLAAFTAATLNNQPMGFYQPFTIIKDAQRHGLKVKPVDVTCSNWECTIEVSGQRSERQMSDVRCQRSDVRRRNQTPGARFPTDYWPLTTDLCLRLGLLCVKGLREEAGRAIVRARSERSFSSLDDLHGRVPELRKDELRKLAAVGALNFVQPTSPKPKPILDVGRGTLDAGFAHRRDALWQVERVSRDAGPCIRWPTSARRSTR